MSKQQTQYFQTMAKDVFLQTMAQHVREDQLDAVNEVLSGYNLNILAGALEASITDKVDFKTIKKVDKFLQSEDFLKVHGSVQEVLKELSPIIEAMILQVFTAAGLVGQPEVPVIEGELVD